MLSLAGIDLVDVLARPSSIALVGASAKPGSYSHRIFTYLRDYGYAGRVTLVNSSRSDVDGVPCFNSIGQIPADSVDLAVIAVPADQVAGVAAELADIGVKAAVAIASGVDRAGKASLRATAEASGMRILGPNCIGVVARKSHTYASFSAVIGQREPKEGRVALVTQSGAMGNALMLSIQRRGAGVSHWFTTGDEANVGALELIAGLLGQDDVSAVGVFFEGMGDLEWLPRIRCAIEATGKQVYVVKGAQTAAGRSAAAGHTGRVVGSGEASVSVMRDAGIRVLGSMAQLADVLVATDLIGSLPGPRIGVVSVSGGCGVLAADAIARSDALNVAALGMDSVLEGKLGGRVHEITNPLDVAGSPTEVFADWVTTVASRPSCDAVVAIQANIMHDEALLAQTLRRPADGTPIIVAPFSEEDPLSGEVIEALASNGIAVMPSAERAIAALAALPQGNTSRDASTDADPAAEEDPHNEAGVGGLEQALTLLPPTEFPWVPMKIVESTEDARRFALEHGFPVVLKAAGRALHHRSESGGVLVNVTEETIDDAFGRIDRLARTVGDAVLIQLQGTPGTEVMVSAMVDPELGPLVVLRPGGIITELLNGSTILWDGWSADQRRVTVEESVAGSLLTGYRGGEKYDLGPLMRLIENLLNSLRSGRLDFVELNPVLVNHDGVQLVDALIRSSHVSEITHPGAT
ncbi:acetate--CoA ligase family protein [Nocardia salmonicida]|uniref:acetate--CoA ligase family protein n=1 Tax=Nocardia salmonicida TaxID=53431 RepID=UPI00366ECC6F